MGAVAILAIAWPAVAQDRAATVMEEARAALGGARLTRVKALAIEGPFAREMGPRRMQGTVALTLQLPANMYRSEETEMMGGLTLERTAVLAGDKAWEDVQNRGGMGGNVQLFVRDGPPGRELNAEQVEAARLRRLRLELTRYLLMFAGGAGLQATYVAVAEAPDGKADVVEVKGEDGQAVRLFVDQASHLPLMLQYQELRPRMIFNGPGGRRGGGAPDGPPPGGPGGMSGPPPAGGRPDGQRPDPEEIRRRMENMPPPEPVAVTLYLDDYKEVDGVKIPHRLSQSVDGKTVEEWTIEKVKINPDIKADFFQKK